MLRFARYFPFSTYRSIDLTASFSRKANLSQFEDRILRESETLGLLVKNSTVRVQFSPKLPERLTQSLSITNDSPIEVQSSVIKSLIRKENVSIRILEETEGSSLVIIEPNQESKSSSSSYRDKLLKMRTNIDDHMLGIKVKQATELAAKGHEVSINVRLTNQQLRQINDSQTLSEEQKLSMKKNLYDSNIKRFTEAFKGCTSKNPKLIESNDLREFTIVLSPRQ
ncbi:unnamed protein product [Rodentolepis nana]|uniref:RRF domain-containing protein n=1 Tax=Rodentolepis nana TaxID=102285 RepID=A0A0R3T913_RODNA|nr:unnamed protein product [Rodentolepis nana]